MSRYKEVTIGTNAVVIRGDATKILSSAEFAGKVDLIFTDPPYGHNNNDGDFISQHEAALGGKAGESRPILNDDLQSATGLFKWLLRFSASALRPGAWLDVCCGGGGGPEDIQFARWALMMRRRLRFEQMVVWDKGPMGLGWRFRRSWECVLTATQPGAKPVWTDETKKVENVIRPGMWGVNKIIPSKHQHPTEKPVELAALFIRLHTQPGDLVLDPFMGSASTGAAAITTCRRFLGVELDRHWFKVAVKRLRGCHRLGLDTGSRLDQPLHHLKPLFDAKGG